MNLTSSASTVIAAVAVLLCCGAACTNAHHAMAPPVDPAAQQVFLRDKPVALHGVYTKLYSGGPENAASNQTTIALKALELGYVDWAERAMYGALFRLGSCGSGGASKHSIDEKNRQILCDHVAASVRRAISALQEADLLSAYDTLSAAASRLDGDSTAQAATALELGTQ